MTGGARLDERRTEHLIGISSAIERYWGRYRRLPASLDELEADQPWIGSEPVDPAASASRARRDGRPEKPVSCRIQRCQARNPNLLAERERSCHA